MLSEWVLAPDEGKRFDAMALIRRFRVKAAEPALVPLAAHLQHAEGPGAPFEREKVNGLLAELANGGS